MRFAVAIAALALFAADTAAQQWGTVKGQVMWAGGAIPKPKVVDVGPHKDCLAHGPLESDELVIDAKTKGVKDVMVWLAPIGKAAMPIHPDLQKVSDREFIIDQARCLFEPRITMMREGQVLVVKNSANMPHNVHIEGDKDINRGFNEILSPKGEKRFEGAALLKAQRSPLTLQCDIHTWMKGRIGVFKHPYFAVTKEGGAFELKDAPAGNYLIYIRHEACGWLHSPRLTDKEKKEGGSFGQPIAIPPGGTLDLPKIKYQPEYLPKELLGDKK